jgi:hypothetical protein
MHIRAKPVDGMLFVKMEEGVILQQYGVIMELIANGNEAPSSLPEGVETLEESPGMIPGVKYFRLKAIRPIDMDELRREIELYEKVLMAA